ncbi:S-layer homology domain-containing protein [Collinsella tanakaei]|uniref:S-layer homology domain-containing protein n=1 Tax=Collinsella tanakaei TaxID=626935 RepID=UPI0026ED9EF3|nr:S-layer homology domain-containing protein [Collinsella tanakaei]
MSISKDGGKTWEWELVNEFVDYPSQNGGHKGNSASFIDPTFIQGGDGTVYMMADAWPAGTGIWGTGGASCESTGFDENGNFLISRGKAGAIAGLDADQYTYYCDAAAKQTFSVDGAQVELVPIKDKDGALTGSWVDAYFDLYTVADGAAFRTVVKQHESGRDIQANVFYSQSEWKAYPTCYIWLVKGTPTQDGIDWGEPSILNVKRKDDQPFTGICPGRGLVVPLQGGGERIMFQIYESKQGGNESASAIWSDDAGATWQRGERSNKFNGSGKSSESQTVRLPGGGVRMYSRNSAGAISYADSFDNGQTWSAYTLDTELQYTGNCMVSFINVDGCLVDAQGRVWSNLIAASYPKTSGRRDGAVRIGSIDAATNKVTWLNANDIKFPGRFLYSCLTQVDGDKMAIVYEQQEPKSDGTQDVIFNQFSLLDLLDEGWSYSAATPALAVSNMVEALDVDEEIELSAAVDGVDAVDSCLETYDTEAAAEQQKDLLDNAAKKLFRAQRDLAAKPLPEPDPEPQPQPQPQPQPDRDNIKVETDEAGNKVTTTTHKDGTSTVDITAPDGVSTTIELDKDGDATAISATVPASVAKSSRATLPLKHAIAGASGADAPAITIDIAGAAPARPLQVSLDSQDGELAPGTVAVLVDANGNEKVLAKTALANNRVSFPIENDATIKIVDRGKSFEDVRETDWFAQEVVGYASARGIINGVPGERGALQFQGNAAASRAMFVCMLANLEDARQDQPQSAFTDVAQSDWFANGAAWGSENGIVAGYGDGSVFGGEDPVTREQVAVFLMRYATMLGLDTSARLQPTHPDAGSTSQFAADAMQWAVAEGLILGNGSGMLNPASTATRAEVAAILARFINTQLA